MPLRASYVVHQSQGWNRFAGPATTAILLSAVASVLSLTLSAGAQSAVREQVIYSFSGNCFKPLAPLIADAQGNLYGTASGGGTSDPGCVFELSPNGDGTWTEKSIHLFDVNNGYQPTAALVFDNAGNLYGTAATGGLYGGGVVFELTPLPDGEWTDSILYNFGRSGDGINAATEVVFGPDGSLYGATEFGGSGECGIVYRLSLRLGAWSETTVHDFAKGTQDGCNPRGGVVFDRRGRVFGTTSGGGAQGFGTVYELIRSKNGSYREHLIHNFSGADGALPLSTLVIDGNGHLYGTSFDGGNLTACAGGCGAVFKLSNSGGKWLERVLFALSGSDGEDAVGSVVFDRDGNLYAAAAHGGGTDYSGVIFGLTPQPGATWKQTVLHRFPWPSTGDGASPYAGFILRGGELFGTTLAGGASNNGAVVSISR